ncbi:hypothetical protein ACIBEJ_19040 [Nonomuraea sp. NPDC050790]|uniref:hypothetical protein n=1 Tax=Nonomuraea sp. NPDC050790 TaxID=3364371 RepID=UPI0037A564B7
MFLRVALILQTVALFAAPITAGLLLTTPSGLALHSASAYTIFAVGLVHLLAAVLAWRPGGGSPRPILGAAVFFALTLAQIALGIAGVKTVHVPLGVLMFGMSMYQLARLRPAPQSEQAARTV